MTANRHIKRSLARERVHARALRVPSLPHLTMILIGLLALAIQSFIVQTHIHSPRGAAGIQTVSIATAVKGAVASAIDASANTIAPRDKYPINEDPSNCPLCQEISHAGQFVAGAVVLVALRAAASVHFIPWAEAAIPSFAVTHIWRSRAPPAPQS
jgi:hypothetical protein